MNIAQCCLSIYQAINSSPKVHVYKEPRLLVHKVIRPNMVLLSDNRRVALHDIITPRTDSRSPDERQAAIYVMRQMSYRFIDKQVSLHNESKHLLGTVKADIACGDKTMKQWLIEHHYAVREHTPTPCSWLEYIATSNPRPCS